MKSVYEIISRSPGSSSTQEGLCKEVGHRYEQPSCLWRLKRQNWLTRSGQRGRTAQMTKSGERRTHDQLIILLGISICYMEATNGRFYFSKQQIIENQQCISNVAQSTWVPKSCISKSGIPPQLRRSLMSVLDKGLAAFDVCWVFKPVIGFLGIIGWVIPPRFCKLFMDCLWLFWAGPRRLSNADRSGLGETRDVAVVALMGNVGPICSGWPMGCIDEPIVEDDWLDVVAWCCKNGWFIIGIGWSWPMGWGFVAGCIMFNDWLLTMGWLLVACWVAGCFEAWDCFSCNLNFSCKLRFWADFWRGPGLAALGAGGEMRELASSVFLSVSTNPPRPRLLYMLSMLDT